MNNNQNLQTQSPRNPVRLTPVTATGAWLWSAGSVSQDLRSRQSRGAMGGSEEFVGLYEREAESVLVFFARRTLDAELALDLTAETFAQAWRGWAGVRTESREEVRAWVFTIARRQLGRYWRRGRVEHSALRRLGVELSPVDDGDVVEIEQAAGPSRTRRRPTRSRRSRR